MICGAQEEKFPWGTCLVVPKKKIPFEDMRGGGDQAKKSPWGTWFVVPKKKNPLGGHDLRCPRRQISLGACFVVPKNKNPHGGLDLWCPKRKSPWRTWYVVFKKESTLGEHDLWCPRRKSTGEKVLIYLETPYFLHIYWKNWNWKKKYHPEDLIRHF